MVRNIVFMLLLAALFLKHHKRAVNFIKLTYGNRILVDVCACAILYSVHVGLTDYTFQIPMSMVSLRRLISHSYEQNEIFNFTLNIRGRHGFSMEKSSQEKFE